MIRPRIFFGLIFLAISVVFWMGSAHADTEYRKNADQLTVLAQRLTDYETMKAKFSQTRRLGAAGRTLTSSGNLTVARSGAFEWIQTTPFRQTVRLEKTTFSIQYESDPPEVMTAESHPAVWAAAELLVSIVRMDLSALRKHFRAALDQKSDGTWTLVLEPEEDVLKRLLGVVTLAGDDRVRVMTMEPSADNRTEMKFSDIVVTPRRSTH